MAVTLDGCRVLRDQNGRHDSEGSEEDLLQENNEISLITRAVIVSSHKMWRGREDRHLPSMAPSPPQEKERNRVEIQISIPSSYCTVQYPTSFFPSSFPQLYSFPRTPHSFLRTWLPFSAAADAASGCTHERGGEIEDTLLPPPSLPPLHIPLLRHWGCSPPLSLSPSLLHLGGCFSPLSSAALPLLANFTNGYRPIRKSFHGPFLLSSSPSFSSSLPRRVTHSNNTSPKCVYMQGWTEAFMRSLVGMVE